MTLRAAATSTVHEHAHLHQSPRNEGFGATACIDSRRISRPGIRSMALSHLDSTLAISIHMMRRNESSKVAPLSLLAVALLLAPASAEAGYPDLCTAVGAKACVYTGPVAPTLAAPVCWNRVDVRLKGAGDCPAGSYPFFLDHGEIVNPLLGLVVAYAPLPNACDMGYCSTTEFDYEDVPGEALCCNPDTDDCSPLDSGCTDDIVFCDQPASDENGSIVCHDE
jgi:hypothetical protein